MKINRQILKLAFGLFLTINAFGQIPTNGLVAYYPFNGNANDESGNGNNGTVIGANLSNNRFNSTVSSMKFNGTSTIPDYIDLGISPSLKITGKEITISTWINITGSGFNSGRIVLGGRVNQEYTLVYESGKILWRPTLTLTGGGISSFGHPSAIFSNLTLNFNNWYHVVASYDGNFSKIYINGIVNNSSVSLTGLDLAIDNNTALIGGETNAHSSGGNSSFQGNIDDIRIYSRALNQSEISALYTEGCDAYFAQAPTLTFDGTSMLTQTYAGANYAWSLNGSSISGANSNIYSGTISAGTYMVTVTNAACKSSASFVQANDVVNTLSGLVAYYPFNGNANEENNNWINGTITGATNTTDRYEEVNKSLNFTNNTFVSFGSNSVPPIILGNKTKFVSAWIMPTQNRNSIFCLGTNITNGNTYRFISNTNGFLGLDVTNGSGYSNSVKLELNIWNFVFSYFDGTKYIVGKVNESGILTSSISGMPLNNLIQGTFEIGKETFSNFYTNGKLDEVRLYNRVLNPSEISALYTEGCDAYPTLTLDGTSMLTQTYAGANYAWSLNGSSISGANSNVYSGTISAGTYNVTITNAACKSVASYVQANDVVNTANGLVAYYPFNGNANDESGNGNNGSIINTLTLTGNRFQLSNSSYQFKQTNSSNTTDGYISVNTTLGNVGTGDFSYSLWYNTSDKSKVQYLIGKRSSSQSNSIEFVFYDQYLISSTATVGVNIQSSALIVNNNEWHLATLTRENGVIKLYNDSKLVSTPTNNTNNINNNSLLKIGASSIGSATPYSFFNGKLDDVRFYNRALNPSEIQALWDNCIGTDINTMNLPISGSNSVCLGSSNTFSIASTTGISYNWAVSGGNTFTVNGNNLNVSANNLGVYTITAVPTYACGNGTVTSSFVVSVSGAAPTPTITGNLLPKSCISENYLATVSSGSGSYTWATSDSHILASASTVGITFTSTGIKQISVTRIDAQCNFSTTSSINVTVTAPNLATPILARTTNLSNLHSTNVTTPGTSFQWVKDNLDEAGETSSTHNNQLENATYKLRADLGLCATAVSDPYNVFVVTFIPAAVTVVSPPVTITSAPVTITSAPVTVTSAPVTITSAPITVTSVVTVSSPPVTVTSVVTVSSPPVTVTSVINNCTSTGTNNNRLTTSFSIYPNPSSGVFTIESEGVEIYSIKVYASDGRLVYNEKFASKLDLSNLPSGIYKLIAYDKEDKPLGSVNIAKE